MQVYKTKVYDFNHNLVRDALFRKGVSIEYAAKCLGIPKYLLKDILRGEHGISEEQHKVLVALCRVQ